MSLIAEAPGKEVHYPSNPNKFEFDGEVASIFDSMALRSIPNYAEVHRLHTSMFSEMFQPGAVVADIGASTGNFFGAIERAVGKPFSTTGILAYAYDTSSEMLARLHSRYPTVRLQQGDIATAADLPQPADMIVCLYVLQFMRGKQREEALAWIKRNLAPHGVVVLGQKEHPHLRTAAKSQEEYFAFRRSNGYTQAEIDAKTAALANSMWPVSQEVLEAELEAFDMSYVETTRWVQFTSGIAFYRK